jgi:hypothetical protein
MPPEILETISGLANTVQQLQNGMASIAQHINAPPPAEAEEDEDIAIDASKLEGMSRAELVNLVLGVVDKKISSTARQLDSKVTGLEQGVRTYVAQEDVRRAADSHPDFWEWKDEMTELARDNPSLTADRLYKLARAENPDKAEKVNARYTKPAAPAPATKPKAYGGLFPSSATMAPMLPASFSAGITTATVMVAGCRLKVSRCTLARFT